MKKKDLKTGMIVETVEYNRYMVLKNTGLTNSKIAGNNILLRIDERSLTYGWLNLQEYTDDLQHKSDSYFDIICVYAAYHANDIGDFKKYEQIWNRENFE